MSNGEYAVSISEECLAVKVASSLGKACELLLRRGSGHQKVKGLLRMIRERAAKSCNERGFRAMNEDNDQIAISRQKPRSVVSVDARAVFGKSDITNIVQAIFDTPMSTGKAQQGGWGIQFKRLDGK